MQKEISNLEVHSSAKTKLNDMKIKYVITMIFGVLLLLLLLLGGVSVYYSKNIASQTSILYQRPHTNLVGMWEIKAKASSVGSSIMSGLIDGQPLRAEEKEIIETLGSKLKAIESNKVDKNAPVSENMQAIMNAEDLWSKKAKEISGLLDSGEASSVTKEAIQEYQTLEDSLIDNLDTIIDTASSNALKFKNKAEASANQTVIIIVLLFLFAMVFTVLMLRLVWKSISHPLDIMIHVAKEISRGNLNEPITYQNQSEFGELADCFCRMQDYLKEVVKDIEKVLEKMGDGNFNVHPQIEYIGDFSPISDALENISSNLSAALGRISVSADQVTEGVTQLKEGASSLSEGASDQSAAVEELTATVNSISDQVTLNAQNAQNASQKVKEVVDRILTSNTQMQKLKDSMEEISQKSSEIGNIIKTIDDIASQTNLLSLNASIEAARAGELGKGFAVVANEVKSLAEQSSVAVKDTTELVKNCLEAVEKGTFLTEETAEILVQIADEANEITGTVNLISDASQDQAEAVNQINQGMEQISEVIQNNTAAADETASSSENLSDLAHSLENLVNEFRF